MDVEGLCRPADAAMNSSCFTLFGVDSAVIGFQT